jgi:hypothetical protein
MEMLGRFIPMVGKKLDFLVESIGASLVEVGNLVLQLFYARVHQLLAHIFGSVIYINCVEVCTFLFDEKDLLSYQLLTLIFYTFRVVSTA